MRKRLSGIRVVNKDPKQTRKQARGGDVQSDAPRNQRMSLEQALGVGTQFHQAGRVDEAENVYRQILASAPNEPNAMRFLGN